MSQGFQLSRLQAPFRKFCGRKYNNDLYLPIEPLVQMLSDVSYQSLSRSWHIDLDYGSYRLSNLEIGLTACVTGQQVMLTSPWHLIPPLIYLEVRFRPISDNLWFVFPIGLMKLIAVRYFCHFIHIFIYTCVYTLKFYSMNYFIIAGISKCEVRRENNWQCWNALFEPNTTSENKLIVRSRSRSEGISRPQ
jgi:hypothetical protein